MPLRQVPNSNRQYHLVAFDKSGRERKDDPDGVMSDRVANTLQAGGVTDVFIVSHGWKGDIPAAIEQYDRWISVMIDQADDVARMGAKFPNYRPLIIGLHWPSQPWGEEEVGGGASFAGTASVAGSGEFDAPSRAPTVEELIDRYTDRLSDGDAPDPELREQIRRVVEAARKQMAPPQLPPDVVEAYKRIDALANLGSGNLGSGPGEDRAPFDPQRAYRATKPAVASFGGDGLMGGLLSPLRQLSFWKMKKRAQVFGESGAASLLQRLQGVGGPDLRFHAAGHSFGCIVVSAMLRGGNSGPAGRAPIHSVSLLQGAMSHWSYCSHIEQSNNEPGYFRPVIDQRRVRGPIVTTQSRFDKAVGFWYPKAAGVMGQVAFALGLGELPKFGAVGTFGIQGADTNGVQLDMLRVGGRYGFRGGQIYNVNADQFIRNGGGFSGAHSDIAHPEVAHAVWEAVLAD